MILRSAVLGLLLSVGAFAQHTAAIKHTTAPDPLDSMVESFPTDSVEPRYDKSYAFCPRDDFKLKWFVRKATYEVPDTESVPDVPKGRWLIPPTTQREELVFEARCVKKTAAPPAPLNIYHNRLYVKPGYDYLVDRDSCNGAYLFDTTGHGFCTADGSCLNHPEIKGCHSFDLIKDLTFNGRRM